LGSGFKIALRDLELRGAGNMLGPEQSGHITAVGFELYCQLLKQSISALKGEPVQPRIDVQVRLDFLSMNPEDLRVVSGPLSVNEEQLTTDHKQLTTNSGQQPTDKPSAYIPFNYIADQRQRIEIYRRLAQATEVEQLDRLRKECLDRFGRVPPALELLMRVGELKIIAAGKIITEIETRDGKLMLRRNQDYLTMAGHFPRLKRKSVSARLQEVKRFLLGL
jgi:transcription-repair coupling factor (superfamily II helicase)